MGLRSLGGEDTLEKEMETHSITLAGKSDMTSQLNKSCLYTKDVCAPSFCCKYSLSLLSDLVWFLKYGSSIFLCRKKYPCTFSPYAIRWCLSLESLSAWGSCFSPVWTAAAWIPKPLVHPWKCCRSGSAGQGLSPLLPSTGSLGRMGEGDQLRLESGRERQGPGRSVSLGARVSLERGAWLRGLRRPACAHPALASRSSQGFS